MNIIVDGLHISYISEGSGKKTLLLLHGWGSNKEAFAGLVETYKSNYTVIAVDLPGFGGSQLPASAWGVDTYADFVIAFLKKLDVSVDVLVGHSMGGRIALHLTGNALLEPEKMVLIGSHGINETKSVRNRAIGAVAKMGKALTKPLPKSVQESLQKQLYAATGASDYLQAGSMKETFKKIIATDARSVAANITVPTLLIYGLADDQTPPEFGRIFAHIIPGSSLEIVADAGHYAHNDQPAIVAGLITSFLE